MKKSYGYALHVEVPGARVALNAASITENENAEIARSTIIVNLNN